MTAPEGGQPPADAPSADQPPPPPSPPADPDCVITTVVAGHAGDPLDSLPPLDLGEWAHAVAAGNPPGAAAHDRPMADPPLAGQPQEAAGAEPPVDPTPATDAPPPQAMDAAAPQQVVVDTARLLAAVDGRLASLEAVPGSVEALGRATRQELERCANVLFGHDRALNDARERLAEATARLDALEARSPAERPPPALVAPPGRPVDEKALAHMLEQLAGFDRRLGAMESRVEPLEAVPTVVQALRRAVRASDDLMAGEVSAREAQLAALAGEVAADAQAREEAMRRRVSRDLDRLAGIAAAQAQTLEELTGRVAAAEARLAPLDSAPADIEALSRILRRELDAVTADNQARDQVLRRALKNEIDQLHAASEAREKAAVELAARLELVDGRLQESTQAAVAAAGSANTRLDALEGRMAVADGLGPEIEGLRELVRTELDRLGADAKAHDQVMGEITRKVSALDGRMARFDPVPGELQSLRTALRLEAERSLGQLRAVEERLGQLAWVPGEFQEARKRILALTSGLALAQDSIRSLETSLASTHERLKGLGARLGAQSQGPTPP
jgi:predicted  nucleic acid-binding Zn-ribbon protein